ncbi:MAG TPA: hypothetical protein ENJ80_12745 [Gammaproteobacteria bacterium]|nr:hypothetical protein [Gammaproteobacteria bacterium]
MTVFESKTLTVAIDAPYEKIMTDLADPMTHPEWAKEFFAGPAEKSKYGYVLAPVPMMGGAVKFKIESDITLGILDLYLAPPDADFGTPLQVRVIRNGDGANVLWTLLRFPGMSDSNWEDGLVSMSKELCELKKRHEET